MPKLSHAGGAGVCIAVQHDRFSGDVFRDEEGMIESYAHRFPFADIDLQPAASPLANAGDCSFYFDPEGSEAFHFCSDRTGGKGACRSSFFAVGGLSKSCAGCEED